MLACVRACKRISSRWSRVRENVDVYTDPHLALRVQPLFNGGCFRLFVYARTLSALGGEKRSLNNRDSSLGYVTNAYQNISKVKASKANSEMTPNRSS